ncbi:hypothetical protein F442_13028 [Phytophthora nicotianae P10297]|uniref:SWIM-type domain-containing protein n=1 Tax=Phytophthora nicotianae P10297 TaxID=1317064 RepID=W2YWH3_PHYNI|nr:hypothetical protein F442_13028 [Phytophthora nicotianae P10297]
MPADGWLVVARTCSCRFHAKFDMCIHDIHGTRELGLPCPGMPDPVRLFVSINANVIHIGL